ncbi:MAG: methionine--tRNA ligase [Coriobacteriales bacterium]|jgi:methionyl-tRNA synthetase|nr:methionine--tRNA ligase [Coriobacteriales bacterium]
MDTDDTNFAMNPGPSYYLTTPIYYVNGTPHLGTAYTTIAADALARFERMDGRDTWFLTGLDEHGQKVAQAAASEGITPQEWVDAIAPEFLATWKALNVTNDDFIRTTEQRHVRGVQRFFEALRERGAIYQGDYEGHYCVFEETFFTDEQLAEFAERQALAGEPATSEDGTKLCPDCHRPLSFVKEDNLFFRLSAFQEQLLAFYEANPDFIQPEIRRNEVLSFVRSGLKDLSVSRTTFDWGVPIPFAPGHVSYVWVDALINYITAIGYGSDDAADQAMFERHWPAQVHFVGKDIIRFHCVIWPAMLMAAGIEPPRRVFAHGFLLTKGEKMSKSRGNVTAPLELARIFTVDGYRYYFLSDVQFGADGSISLERMVQVYNADLANTWGNLCSRVLNMSVRYLDGLVPELWEKTTQALTREMGNPLAELASEGLYERYVARMNAIDYSGALSNALELAERANLYVEESAPWALAKAAQDEAAEYAQRGASPDEATAPTQADRLAFVLYNLLETIRILALYFAPIMPESSAEAYRRLGLGDIFATNNLAEATRWGGLAAGSSLTVGDPLFPRLDIDELGQ